MSDMRDTISGPLSRFASSVLVVVYLLAVSQGGDLVGILRTFGFCLVPWFCIWFPEALGEMTGSLMGSAITRGSPPAFVWFFGWVVLLLPVLGVLYWWSQGVDVDSLRWLRNARG